MASPDLPDITALNIAIGAEMRGDLARLGLTAGELADYLGTTAHTIGTRLSGKVPFPAVQLEHAAHFVGTDGSEIMRRARQRLADKAVAA